MKAGRLLKDRDDVDVTKLPCFLCLTKVTPLKVDGWLAQLEQTAQSGSLHDVLTHIHLLRHQLNEDAELQLAANLTKEERE